MSTIVLYCIVLYAIATEQDLRRKRQNTFAPEVPRAWIEQRGGRAALRAEMRQLT